MADIFSFLATAMLLIAMTKFQMYYYNEITYIFIYSKNGL